MRTATSGHGSHSRGLTGRQAALHVRGMSETERDEAVGAMEEEIPAVEGVEVEEAAGDTVADADPLAELTVDLAKWKELALRTAADLENYRKRMAREKEEAVRWANQGLLEDLLPILDNFEMGMQAASKEQSSMIYIGMDMVRRQLNDFLSNQGAKEVPAEGCAFDPNVHEAVAQETSDTVAEGNIVRVVRRGFLLRDRLVRPATVVVSQGPSASSDS